MKNQRNLFRLWVGLTAFCAFMTLFVNPGWGALLFLNLFIVPFTNSGIRGRLGTSPFQEIPCTIVVNNNFDTCGTITRASVASLTPSQLLDIFKPGGLSAEMDAWFKTAFEMKACGTKINGLYEWLMSSNRQMGAGASGGGNLLNYTKLDRGPSLLHPFVMARQDSVINDEYWSITGGAANSAYTGDSANAGATTYTSGPLTAAQKALGNANDRVVRVVAKYGLDLDVKEFISRDRVYIFGRASGVSTRGAWHVLASAISASGLYIDLLLRTENLASTTPHDAAPTAGILLQGANNVNDFESWCNNRPTRDPRKRVPFWYQTMRRTRCVDSEYEKVFARLMESNEYFRNFGDLEMAERNRQDEERYQSAWLNTFFFGKAISTNQTLANWQNLEQILTTTGANVDPGLGGKLIAYRANMIGVYEQLRACGQVKDLQNAPLNFYEFLDANYDIMRSRKSQGKAVTSIDWYTDSTTAANLATAFFAYWKAESLEQFRVTMELNKPAPVGMGFIYSSYEVKRPSGVRINIITHEFFDDLVNALSTEAVNIASSGRFLMALEMGKGGTVYPGMIATNRVTHTQGELAELARIDTTFACVMQHVTQKISLTSETATAIVECPSNNLIIEGIADGVPITTGRTSGSSEYGYSDLY